MKRIILATLVVVFIQGCASPRVFKWSSDTGKRCYYTCLKDRSVCASQANNIPSVALCNDSQIYCIQACPDVTEVIQKTEP